MEGRMREAVYSVGAIHESPKGTPPSLQLCPSLGRKGSMFPLADTERGNNTFPSHPGKGPRARLRQGQRSTPQLLRVLNKIQNNFKICPISQVKGIDIWAKPYMMFSRGSGMHRKPLDSNCGVPSLRGPLPTPGRRHEEGKGRRSHWPGLDKGRGITYAMVSHREAGSEMWDVRPNTPTRSDGEVWTI